MANPIQNGSFQQVQNDNPVGWTRQTWSGKGQLELAKIGHDESMSVVISSAEGGNVAWTQRVKLLPLTRYRLSGWIKTEDLKPGSGEGALLNLADMQGVKTQPVTGTRDWTRVHCEFQALGESVQINCQFGGWGVSMGKAWYDDIKMEILSDGIPESRTLEAVVDIDAGKKFEPISPYIYGQFIEHLGRCIYGGIWAEMLEDRKFYYPVPAEGEIWHVTGSQACVLAASPWQVIGAAGSASMTTGQAYSGEQDCEITAAGDATGIYQDELGLVAGKEYVGRIVIAGDQSAAPVRVSLVWGAGPDDRETVNIKKLSGRVRKQKLAFRAGGSTGNGRLEIVSEGRGSFRIGAVSLMPADNVEGFRADTLALLRELNSPIYRWPGGNFVSGYDWRDGLGERDRRPTRTNPAWTGIETNDVGLDEFVRFCRLIDTEPMIAVNTGFGDAYSAAAEVEYANGSSKTYYGKKRAQNGHKKPYQVKWWCVGNEMYGGWQMGYMKLHHYVLKHNQVEEKMRQVDPAIKTIGVGNVGDWTEGMLTSCSNNMDLISEHFYCQTKGDLLSHIRQIPHNVKHIADAHREYRRSFTGPEWKAIPVALDEWNYWYGPHVYGELGTRYFLQDALGIAAGLHEYFRNSDIYFMANYAQTVNVIGCIKTTKTEAGFATTALPLMLYRKYFGTIPVRVAASESPLDITAAWTTDGTALTVAVVNPTWDTYRLKLNIENARAAQKAKTWVITGENPIVYNTPGEEPKVAIKKTGVTDLTAKAAIAPLSVTLYKMPVQ
jgi:alpha-N-arabinofuranosidase